MQKLTQKWTDDRHRKIEREAYYLWEQDGKPHGKSDDYWFLARQKLRREAVRWILWEFLPCRLIWEKVVPPKEPTRKPYSTFILWVLGIHFTAFGIASARYEARKDALETRLTVVVTQLGTESRKRALERAVQIQRSPTPINPEIFPKFWTPYISLFGSEIPNREIVAEVKDLLATEKDDLANLSLWWIDLSGANLLEANLEGASLGNANLKGTTLGLANLKDAELVLANLEGANLALANLRGVNLIRTNLKEVDLTWANLKGVNLILTNLKGANLNGADLREAENLPVEQVKQACFWRRAKFDADFLTQLYNTSDPNPLPDCSRWNADFQH